MRWWPTSDETPGKAVGDRVGGRPDVDCEDTKTWDYETWDSEGTTTYPVVVKRSRTGVRVTG